MDRASDRHRAVEVLVQFARLASDAVDADAILAHLADALVADVRSDGVVIVALDARGAARVTLTRGLLDPSVLAGLEIESFDHDLGAQILRATGTAFGREICLPMVAGGDIFGAAVMLYRDDRGPDSGDTSSLAEALVDLCAVTVHAAAQLDEIQRSHAELRASQELLVRSEKLRALGQMAAGISHDLRNILHPLSLHLQLLEEAIGRGRMADALESIPRMKQCLDRGLTTIDLLRDYGRQDGNGKLEKVNLDQVAHEAVLIAKPRIASAGPRRAIALREELGHPCLVEGVAAELVSVVVNLAVNAIDAIASDRGKGVVRIRTGMADGGSFLEVVDDGPGMPPEVAQRVFEPFFSTKGDQGTGLGLAMVEATARRLGGKLSLSTAPARGTTLRLWLPCAEPDVTAAS